MTAARRATWPTLRERLRGPDQRAASATPASASRRWSTRWCPDADRGDRRRQRGHRPRPAHLDVGADAARCPDGDGWIVDTPGIRSFGLAHVDPAHADRRVPRPRRAHRRTARAAAPTARPSRSAGWTRRSPTGRATPSGSRRSAGCSPAASAPRATRPTRAGAQPPCAWPQTARAPESPVSTTRHEHGDRGDHHQHGAAPRRRRQPAALRRRGRWPASTDRAATRRPARRPARTGPARRTARCRASGACARAVARCGRSCTSAWPLVVARNRARRRPPRRRPPASGSASATAAARRTPARRARSAGRAPRRRARPARAAAVRDRHVPHLRWMTAPGPPDGAVLGAFTGSSWRALSMPPEASGGRGIACGPCPRPSPTTCGWPTSWPTTPTR